MKKMIITILIFFFGLLLRVSAISVDEVEIKNYANDYANVLSPEIENYINEQAKKLEDVDGTQIVVVTIDTIDGESLELFANKLFNRVGIGDKKKNNGLLILLVVDDRLLRVEVGDGLEGILPDGKVGRFEDRYMIPSLKTDNWEEAVKIGFDAFYSEIIRKNNIDLEAPIDTTEDEFERIPLAIYIIVFFLGFIIAEVLPKKLTLADFVATGFIFTPPIWAFIKKMTYFECYLVISITMFLIYLLIRFSSGSSYGGGSSGGGGSYHSYSSHSSSHSFSGGGGHSSGGGASRHF